MMFLRFFSFRPYWWKTSCIYIYPCICFSHWEESLVNTAVNVGSYMFLPFVERDQNACCLRGLYYPFISIYIGIVISHYKKPY